MHTFLNGLIPFPWRDSENMMPREQKWRDETESILVNNFPRAILWWISEMAVSLQQQSY